MIRDEFDRLFGDVELPDNSELRRHTQGAKISAANLRRWANPEFRKKTIEKMIENSHCVLFYKGKNLYEWAEDLGLSYSTVYEHYRTHGNLDTAGRGLGHRLGESKQVYQGKTYKELEAEHGVTSKTIRVHLKKYGNLDNLPKPNTNEKIVYQGKTYKELEAEYGVLSVTIRAHLKKYGNLDNLKKKQ